MTYETYVTTKLMQLILCYDFLQFIEKLLDDGKRSPRTIRLAALHLTGLWLLYPATIKYYIKELKSLTLYGSGALSFSKFPAINHYLICPMVQVKQISFSTF